MTANYICLFWISFFSLSSMQAIQNLGLAVISIVAGKIVDGSGYLLLEIFFIAWLCRKYDTHTQVQVGIRTIGPETIRRESI